MQSRTLGFALRAAEPARAKWLNLIWERTRTEPRIGGGVCLRACEGTTRNTTSVKGHKCQNTGTIVSPAGLGGGYCPPPIAGLSVSHLPASPSVWDCIDCILHFLPPIFPKKYLHFCILYPPKKNESVSGAVHLRRRYSADTFCIWGVGGACPPD